MKYFAKIALITALTCSPLSFAQTFYIKSLHLNTKDYYNVCNDKCPEIDYELLDTGNLWLDNMINKDIIVNISLNGYEENTEIEKRWKTFLANPNPTKAGLTNQLNFAIDGVLKANREWKEETESELNFSVSSKPTYQGHKTLKNQERLELFSVATEQYTGGAHGMYWFHNYVFNMNSQKRLVLDDILIKGKKSALERLAKQKYHAYLKKHDIEPKEFADMWAFYLTENFTFDNKGLLLVYQPYEITPYVMGSPELHISYAELSGIIKAEYL